MTVPAQDPIAVSTANGVSNLFPYNFRILAAADLEVTVDDVVQTLGVHYSVDGVGNPSGGNVEFLPGFVPADQSRVARRRLMDYERTDDFQTGGDLRAVELNKNLDAAVMMIQQLAGALSLCMQLPPSAFGFTSSLLPEPDPLKGLRWNSERTGLENYEITGFSAPGGSDLIGYIQEGVGAITRTLQQKMREVQLNVREFGGVGNSDGTAGNGTDDSAALARAINAAAGRTVVIPPVPGVAMTYYRIGTNVALPASGRIKVEKGARLVYDVGVNIIGEGTLVHDDLDRHGGFTLYGSEQGMEAPMTGDGEFSTTDFNYVHIRESMRQEAGVGTMTGSKVNGWNVTHNFGGDAAHGGRHALIGNLLHGFFPGEGPTAAANVDRNYVGVQGLSVTFTGDGGTLGSPLGAYFGGSFVGAVRNSAQYVLNLTASEFNTDLPPGMPANAVSGLTGIQIAGRNDQRGYNFDAAISVGQISGSWKHGIAFTNFNGVNPLAADSNGFYIQPGMLCGRGIDMRGVTFTNAILDAPGITLTLGTIDLGIVGSANTPVLDLHSSASITNYDVRIQSTGGSGVDGQGTCAIISGITQLTHTDPQADNVFRLGQASLRWTQLSAATATINTSDENEKQQIEAIPEAWLDAWAEVDYYRFKFNEAVERKGDENARWHVGVVAQRIRDVFLRHGLDATTLGLLCYDEWDAWTEPAQFKQVEIEPEETVTHPPVYGFAPRSKVDETLEYRCLRGEWVEVVKPAVYETVEVRPEIHHPAGHRWGVRGDHCHYLEAALLRRELNRLRG